MSSFERVYYRVVTPFTRHSESESLKLFTEMTNDETQLMLFLLVLWEGLNIKYSIELFAAFNRSISEVCRPTVTVSQFNQSNSHQNTLAPPPRWGNGTLANLSCRVVIECPGVMSIKFCLKKAASAAHRALWDVLLMLRFRSSTVLPHPRLPAGDLVPDDPSLAPPPPPSLSG